MYKSNFFNSLNLHFPQIKSKEQLSIWADGMLDDGSHEMGSSNSLIIHMTKGDIAYCVLPKGQVLAGLRFTSFSGYLLHANSLDIPTNQGQGQNTGLPQVLYTTQGQGQPSKMSNNFANIAPTQGQPNQIPNNFVNTVSSQSQPSQMSQNFVNNVQNHGSPVNVYQNPYTAGNQIQNKQQNVQYVGQGQGQKVPQEIPYIIQGNRRSRMNSNPNNIILF